jgi:lipoate-protein ligase A
MEDDGAAERVPILKRYGGGGAVVHQAGSVVVSHGVWVRQNFHNRFYFERLNQAVIDALALAVPALRALGQRGLSDIVHGERKVGGTSLFRSRNYCLYQASLLVEPRLDVIERYLRHPSKEPDYRQGRPHRAFLVGLGELAPELTPDRCATCLRTALPATLAATLAGELVASQPEQVPGLLRRATAAATLAQSPGAPPR